MVQPTTVVAAAVLALLYLCSVPVSVEMADMKVVVMMS
jgi:hypothetical protein